MHAASFFATAATAGALLLGVEIAGISKAGPSPAQTVAGAETGALQYEITAQDVIDKDTLIHEIRVDDHVIGRRMGKVLFAVDGTTFRVESEDKASPASRSDVTEALSQYLYDFAGSPFPNEEELYQQSLSTISGRSDVLIVVLDRSCQTFTPSPGADDCLKRLAPTEVGLSSDDLRQNYLTKCGAPAGQSVMEPWHDCMMRFVTDNLDNKRFVQKGLIPLYLTAGRSRVPTAVIVLAAVVAMSGLIGLILWLRTRSSAPIGQER